MCIHYHLQQGREQCALNSRETVASEMEAITAMWGVVDLLDANLYSQWPQPVFMWPMPREMVFDIVMGRLKIFAQFDFDELFARARERGIELEWIEQRDEHPTMRHSPPISNLRKSRGIRATMPAISSHAKIELMQGFFLRIFLEFMSPDQLLSLIVDSIRSLEQARVSHDEIVKELSSGRQDEGVAARQAKTAANKAIVKAMTAVGLAADPDFFPSAGTGFYRCTLPGFVR